jgi:hypothetical protein
MRAKLKALKVWLQCVWHLHATPRRLRYFYAELCLAATQTVKEIAPGIFVHGDMCTSVFISTSLYDIALNAATYTNDGTRNYEGISIQLGDINERKWKNVFRMKPNPIFDLGDGNWTRALRRTMRANIRAQITALPISPLRGFND